MPFVVTGVRAYQAAGRPADADRWLVACTERLAPTPAFARPALEHAPGPGLAGGRLDRRRPDLPRDRGRGLGRARPHLGGVLGSSGPRGRPGPLEPVRGGRRPRRAGPRDRVTTAQPEPRRPRGRAGPHGPRPGHRGRAVAPADGSRVRGRPAHRRGPHQRRDRRRARHRPEDGQQPRRAHPRQARCVAPRRDRDLGEHRRSEPAAGAWRRRPAEGTAARARPSSSVAVPVERGRDHVATLVRGSRRYNRASTPAPTPKRTVRHRPTGPSADCSGGSTDGHDRPRRRPSAPGRQALHLRLGRRPRRGQRRRCATCSAARAPASPR